MPTILAIDTSNYTTSISVVRNNMILSDRRQLLTVEEGKRGLQQSEAIFKHIKNLPVLMEMTMNDIDCTRIDAVGVSDRPRPIDESYMPVFKAGESFAGFLSSYLKKPLFRFSHQEGHIEAGVFSSGYDTKNDFIALHLSGGTTEILKVMCNKNRYSVDIIGGTSDINAGQFIDRVGVKLGLGFPCGNTMDILASSGNYKNCFLTPSTHNEKLSFSGPETAAIRFVEENFKHEDICAGVFENISRSLIKVLERCMKKYNINNILFVGGVSSSNYIRKYMKMNLNNVNLNFCKPKYSTDNSVGIALLCSKALCDEDWTSDKK